MWRTRDIPLVMLGLILCVSWTEIRALSDKRLCADPKCQEIISLGSAKITYTAGEQGMVSFKINSPIRVKSKSAGSNPRLWGIEVNGREGYAPKEFIMETKVIVSEKNLKYEMPVLSPGARNDGVGGGSEDKNGGANEAETVEIDEFVNPTVAMENTEETAALQPEVPVLLNPSESNVLKPEPDSDTTITSPLDAHASVVDSGSANGIVTGVENASEVKSLEATTVQQPQKHMEIIDGTEIPILDVDVEVSQLSSEKSMEDNKSSNEELQKDSDITDEVPSAAQSPSSTNFEAFEAPTENLLKSQGEELSGTIDLEVTKPIIEDPQQQQLETEDGSSHQINANKLEALDVTDTVLVEPTDLQVEPIVENDIDETDRYQSNEATTNSDVNALGDLHLIPAQTNQEHKTNNEYMVIEEEEEINEIKDNLKFLNLPEKTEQTAADEAQTNKEELRGNVKVNNENINVSSAENEENMQLEMLVHNHEPETIQTYATETLRQAEINVTDLHIGKQTETHLNETESPLLIQDPTLESTESEDFKTKSVITAIEDKIAKLVENTNINPQTQSKFQHDDALQTNTEAKLEVMTLSPDAEQQLEYSSPTTTAHHHHENDQLPSMPQNYETMQQQTEPSLPSYAYPYTYTTDANYDYGLPTPDPRDLYNPQKYSADSEMEVAQKVPAEVINTKLNEGANPHPTIEEEVPSAKDSQTTYNLNNNVNEAATATDQAYQLSKDKANNLADNNRAGEDHVGDLSAGTVVETEPKESTSLPSKLYGEWEATKEQGLFATILGTVNHLISNDRTEKDELNSNNKNVYRDAEHQYCEDLSSGNCPPLAIQQNHVSCDCDSNSSSAPLLMNHVVELLVAKVLEMGDLLACLVVAGASSLLFLFGYYCFCNSSKEGALLSKLNLLERSLLATHKENSILKYELMQTRSKLSSIEDNSFGSNDMVMSLKRELEEEMLAKEQLQEQVINLEKELENAAEAGLELNKIVSELLSNQTGDESIISSVEELQQQLNEQRNTILEINSNLAEKSRENSQLQLMIAEQNARLHAKITTLQGDNDELEAEKDSLKARLEEIRGEFEEDISKALQGKNLEINSLQSDIVEQKVQREREHTKWQTSLAKVEALEECLKSVKRDPGVNINEIINVAYVRAELLDMQKKQAELKERLEAELDTRRLAESQLKVAIVDVEKFKQDYNQSEKDKLEAQTRLEVLSNYFKEKETQLQKELSLKDAMWLKQQGETTSTVDRLTTMQDEIQFLKSQNDSLRAEIEAQLAAHKVQTGTLERRAHETWLAARQSERRHEEARAEATALRRKLTALAGGSALEVNRPPNTSIDGAVSSELNSVPSPIHMESPGSPLLSRMPPPPPFLPPFMPPPPFMGLPPPPGFVPPGEMRPAPLGCIMSPPGDIGARHHVQLRQPRYLNEHCDDDYDDDDDDDDEVEAERRRQDNIGWHREPYSPPRTYRSLSPSDSRYNYTTDRDLMSTYDTETDFSPPPSPRERRRRSSRASSYKSPSISDYDGNKMSGNKVKLSSGSEKSFNAPHHDRKERSMV